MPGFSRPVSPARPPHRTSASPGHRGRPASARPRSAAVTSVVPAWPRPPRAAAGTAPAWPASACASAGSPAGPPRKPGTAPALRWPPPPAHRRRRAAQPPGDRPHRLTGRQAAGDLFPLRQRQSQRRASPLPPGRPVQRDHRPANRIPGPVNLLMQFPRWRPFSHQLGDPLLFRIRNLVQSATSRPRSNWIRTRALR